ncbi:PaaI family thioesterase [Sphaerimonospora mesophila]|uniref:PaaI family thioesterase n=1 Tax=Sphaerimonospora mesophila TaxID=37483 RepID=UPI0006E32D39
MTSTEILDIAAATQVLDSQPFSRVIGARLVEFEPGRATLEIDIRDDLRQQNGFLHGGVLAYAADNALTFAAGSVLGPAVLTGGFSVNYLRPARGGTLRAQAVVVHAGRRQAVARCDLYAVSPEGESVLCAVAQGTVMTTQTS